MSIFRNKNDNDKETVSIYKKEYKRVERERNELLEKLNLIEDYKTQYEDMISDVKRLKNVYEILIKKTERVGNEYKEKLEQITKTE